MSKAEAVKIFEAQGDHLKVEIVSGIPEGSLSCYRQADFVDLCRGPHVPSTGKLGVFKLTHAAGAYWKGDERNPMLQRIYGASFLSQKELDEHLHRLEQARARDHRKLGKELGLFLFHPWAPASPFFLPKGATVYNLLVDYMRSLYPKYGYQEVVTPQVFDVELFKRSGHYENYHENMFFTEVDEREFGVKPMNCPGHFLMFAPQAFSYRDLPVRYADFGRLHRYERSGVTQGLTRVRTFCQDDAHIFVHARGDAGRDGPLHRPHRRGLRDLRLHGREGPPRDAPREVHGDDRELGPRREGARLGVRAARARRTSSTPATARSTARSSTSR